MPRARRGGHLALPAYTLLRAGAFPARLLIMRTLLRTLQDADPALLPLLARVWEVADEDLQHMSHDEAAHALARAMLNAERAERAWDALDDDQRGALQALLSAGSHMTATTYTRLFGGIRHMGAEQIARDKPHLHPATSAEALFYRGLIAQAFEQAEAGARAVIYVPTDLAALLPRHKTGYARLDDDEAASELPPELPGVEPLEDVQNIVTADTSIVDDMVALLAYTLLRQPDLDGDTLAGPHRAALLPHLLARDPARLAFLVSLAVSASLAEAEGGKLALRRAEARRWLEAHRADQVRQLAEAWRDSAAYRDLWHVPGLHPEPTGWPYDPVVARTAVIGFLGEFVPEQDWWSMDEFIEAVKQADPDFQRPGGDYTSWYIRNDEGDYLQGFESWDAVEGALLLFYLGGPMHWLGLVDLAEDAARLTAYGRALADLIPWPNPPETEDSVQVQTDGTLLVSRRVPRIDRFQVARFTTWVQAADPFAYRLDAASLAQAARQGITTQHISAFISRALRDAPTPAPIARLLETWQAGPAASVTLEPLLVLRTTDPETLTTLLDTPELRRYLGAQLGPMAVVVRDGQADALRAALGQHGIAIEGSDG